MRGFPAAPNCPFDYGRRCTKSGGTLNGNGGVYCEDVDIANAVAADSTEDFGVRP
ncbi:hypothetical protein [Pseudomonas sp.]|uniref:hypothetical protein n=1 Tax=Pseudomonas sp. TaxID=306 RepID=UPI00260AB50D|nr:hypothetical protein [Pseudomonas sp.]